MTGVLVGHYLAVALLAAPLGLLGGRLLAPPLLDDTLDAARHAAARAARPGARALVVRCSCWRPWPRAALPAWRAGRLPPVVALAAGRVGAQRASRAARLARALRLPVAAALGAKDAYVQRGARRADGREPRAGRRVVVCALAFEATMDRLAAEPALRAQPWDIAVHRGDAAPSGSTALLASLPGVADVGRRYGVLAMAGGLELEARVIDGSPTRSRSRCRTAAASAARAR